MIRARCPVVALASAAHPARNDVLEYPAGSTESGKVYPMEILLAVVRYAFILGIAIEGVLIARALWRLVRHRPAPQPTTDP